MLGILWSLFGYGNGGGSVTGMYSAIDSADAARRSASNAEKAATEAADIRDRLDKLNLVCLAMWKLLSEQAGITEGQLLDKVREIDLADGVEDGKITKPRTPVECPKCGRVVSSRRTRCLYCGEKNLASGPFDQCT